MLQELIVSSLPKIEQFLKSGQHNTWLKFNGIEVYVRKSHHAIEGNLVKCFDVANINIKEQQRGQGKFTNFLNELEILLPNYDIHYIFIESVLNVRLVSYLPKLGYKKLNINPPSFYKEV